MTRTELAAIDIFQWSDSHVVDRDRGNLVYGVYAGNRSRMGESFLILGIVAPVI